MAAKRSNIASGTAVRPAGGYSVMARRRYRPAETLDYFPTPPFATRALCEFLAGELGDLAALKAWEPAAGEGHMARPLGEYFGEVRASDCFPYSDELEILDFPLLGAFDPDPCDLLITNPPFKLAEQFIFTGLKIARLGVAMLVRSAFIEGQERFRSLFAVEPPTFALQFTERVTLLEGRLIQAGTIDPFSENDNPASSATAYCWLIWIKGRGGDCRLRWIAPCRQRLERPGDYPEYAIQALPPPSDGLFGGERA